MATLTLPSLTDNSRRRNSGDLPTTTLRCYDAVKFVDEILWKSDQTHAKFKLFDSILIENGGVAGWIFESTEGLVKSKSKSRWNSAGISERFFSSKPGPNKMVLFTIDGIFWRSLTSEILDAYLNHSSSAEISHQIVVVSSAHVESLVGASPSFIEQSYDPKAKKGGKNNLTNVLSNPAGKVEKSQSQNNNSYNQMASIIPQHKVVCKNKELCSLCGDYIESLVRILESRKAIKIVSMSIVVVVENDNYMGNVSIGEVPSPRRVWLHHVKDLVFTHLGASATSETSSGINNSVTNNDETSPSVKEQKRQSNWEKKSTTSASSTITMGSNLFTRTAKCSGDFCTYNELDEIRTMQAIATEMRSSVNSKIEIIKAKQRHRRLTAAEAAKSEEIVQQIGFSGGVGSMAVVLADSSENADDNSADDQDNDGLGELPAINQAAHVIPYKAIALGRQDMSMIDDLVKTYSGEPENELAMLTEKVPWSERLLHWWLRVGKATTGKRLGLVPTTAADKISAAILNGNHNSSKLPSVDSKGGAPSSAVEDADTTTSPFSAAVPFDLTDNAYLNNLDKHTLKKKAGILSWYYSECNICEKCFNIYKEIDVKRKGQVSGQFKARRDEQFKRDKELGKLIEKRIFAQRKAATRLHNKTIGGTRGSKTADVHNNKNSTTSRSSNSVLNDKNFSVGDWNNDDDDDYNPHDHSLLLSNVKAAINVSKAILPPMPWQLGDKASRDAYENSGSAFVRNLAKKSEAAVSDAENERIVGHYQDVARVRGLDSIANMSLLPPAAKAGGGNAERSITGVLDDNSDWLDNWKKATGQSSDGNGDGNMSSKSSSTLQGSLSAPALATRSRKVVETEAAPFDPDRLLHPYQRGLQKLREDMRTDEEKAMLAQLNSSSNKGTVKIVLEKKPSAKTVVLPRKTKELIGRNNGQIGIPLHLQLMQERQMQQQQLQEQQEQQQLSHSESQAVVNSIYSNNSSLTSVGSKGKRGPNVNIMTDTTSPTGLGIAFGAGSLSSNRSTLPDSPSSMKSSGTNTSSSPTKSLRKQVSFTLNKFKTGEDGEEDNDDAALLTALPPKPRPAVQSLVSDIVQNTIKKSGIVTSTKHAEKAGGRSSSDENDDDDDDDGEEIGIGWSPFSIPTA